MTGLLLKKACRMLLDAIGDDSGNQDFADALDEIANRTTDRRLDILARDKRVTKALWGEIERHLNGYSVEDEERFVHAVTILEANE